MRIVLLLILLIATVTAKAEWVEGYETSFAIHYVDAATISENGKSGRVWELTDLKKPIGRMRSARVLREYDCAQRKFRTLSVFSFDGQMLSGQMIESINTAGEWIHIPPESAATTFIRLVCP